MVRSRSQGGYGKLAWRQWRVGRFFENGELPRLPIVGGVVHIVLPARCVEISDSIGGITFEGTWDPAQPTTRFVFECADSTHELNEIGCFDETGGDWQALMEMFQVSGFMVFVDAPTSSQVPTEIPPPAIEG